MTEMTEAFAEYIEAGAAAATDIAEVGIGQAPEDEPCEAAPCPHDPPAPPAARRRIHIARLLFITLAASVFALAMYVEVTAAIGSFVPDGICDMIARLSLGGDFAAAGENTDAPSESAGPSESESEPPESEDAVTGVETDPAPPDDTAEPPVTEPPVTEPPDGGDVPRYPIIERDLSVDAERGLSCSNQTDYELDLDHFADTELTIPALADLIMGYPPDTDNPVVLIIHTHGTESYAEEGADSYAENDNSRSTDITKNVVAVGEVMAQYFESRGIRTIHCTEMFDAESYVDSYKNSSAAVREYLAIYPSIRYVFDVHRDSIISDEKVKTRPVTEVDGVRTAQYMCVIGTNAKGANHPDWRLNLALAAHLQARLWNRCSTLTRRMSVRSSSFYQQYAPGSLLFEIGSCGNTLSEAKACALIVAEELAGIIIGNDPAAR